MLSNLSWVAKCQRGPRLVCSQFIQACFPSHTCNGLLEVNQLGIAVANSRPLKTQDTLCLLYTKESKDEERGQD
ncbi:hypothetical protein SKAU_G00311420 [Synaphobranchus kaupii]|uniref:Uncharacterized protein n=1 Tax=Synaphobranchus kaupii TaxID=118154 RepID=A0A9Q1IL34_SYNKA|nr:hypothetical protein SKAU_G00311420 [Synaphobranchus kaupii]